PSMKLAPEIHECIIHVRTLQCNYQPNHERTHPPPDTLSIRMCVGCVCVCACCQTRVKVGPSVTDACGCVGCVCMGCVCEEGPLGARCVCVCGVCVCGVCACEGCLGVCVF